MDNCFINYIHTVIFYKLRLDFILINFIRIVLVLEDMSYCP